MKLVCLDYGRRRCGVAVCDESSRAVRGLPTIDRKKYPDLIVAILGIISREQPEALVIGIPLDINDAETVMSKEIRKFATRLQERCGLSINFVDESLTSRRASELMMHRKKRDRQNKGLVDRLAACLILEQFIKDSEYV